jgi:hypothetical protein
VFSAVHVSFRAARPLVRAVVYPFSPYTSTITVCTRVGFGWQVIGFVCMLCGMLFYNRLLPCSRATAPHEELLLLSPADAHGESSANDSAESLTNVAS